MYKRFKLWRKFAYAVRHTNAYWFLHVVYIFKLIGLNATKRKFVSPFIVFNWIFIWFYPTNRHVKYIYMQHTSMSHTPLIWVNRVRTETKQFLIAFSAEKKQQQKCVKKTGVCVCVDRSTLILFTSRKISLGNGIFMSFEFFSLFFLHWFWWFYRCCYMFIFEWMDGWMNYLWISLCTYQLDWPESEMRSLFLFIWCVLVNWMRHPSLCTHKCRNVHKFMRKLNVNIKIFASTTFQRDR